MFDIYIFDASHSIVEMPVWVMTICIYRKYIVELNLIQVGVSTILETHTL